VTDTWTSDVGPAGQKCPHLAANTMDFTETFHETLHAARAQLPVAWDDTTGRWFVMGADTLFEVAQNWETFSSAHGVAEAYVPKLHFGGEDFNEHFRPAFPAVDALHQNADVN